MTSLYIPVGIPGCGKTTYGKYISGADVVEGADSIRQQLWPGEPYNPSRNDLTFKTLNVTICEALEQDQSVWVDNVNLLTKYRQPFYDLAKKYNVSVHVVVFTNLSQALIQNANRTGVVSGDQAVPDEAMARMVDHYWQGYWALEREPWTTLIKIKEFHVKDLP